MSHMNPGWYEYKIDEFRDEVTGDTRPCIVIDENNDVMIPDHVLIALAGSSLGFGLNPNHVDWDRFYEMWEQQYGYDMQNFGGLTDNRAHRRVGQLWKEGRIEW